MDQLIGQGFLEKVGEYNVLQVTGLGRRALKGQLTPKLLKPAARKERKSRAEEVSWEGVDHGLFDALRSLRRRLADERGLPPFVVFSDATLRDMARRRPSTPERMLQVSGVGDRKLADYGEAFVEAIANHCRQHGLPLDPKLSASSPALISSVREPRPALEGTRRTAFDLFADGQSIDQVCAATSRARSTVADYLLDYIERRQITDPTPWLDPTLFARIRQATEQAGLERLRPIHEALGGEVGYDIIRITVACLRNEAESG
jgi:ATP-dependent DNA helicase RecQ